MDWKEVVKFLASKGKTQQDIAKFCECSQSTIGMLAIGARGKSLSYDIGNKLIEMKNLVESGKIKKG